MNYLTSHNKQPKSLGLPLLGDLAAGDFLGCFHQPWRGPKRGPKDMPFLLELPLYWKNVGRNPRVQEHLDFAWTRCELLGGGAEVDGGERLGGWFR